MGTYRQQPTPQQMQFAQRNMQNAPNMGRAAALRDPNIAQFAGQPPPPSTTSLSEDQRAYIRSLPPEQQAEAIRKLTQDYAGQRNIAGGQMEQAQGVMDEAGPEGRQAGGRVYVAASPLEHLSSGLRKHGARKDYDTALETKKKLSDEYGGGLSDAFRASLYK